MVRWKVRLLTLLTAVLLAGFPVLAAVCDAACASTGQTVSTGPATTAVHHHHEPAAVVALPAAAQAHHHHHGATAPVTLSVETARVEAVPSNDCSNDARLSAWLAEPRLQQGSRATVLPLTTSAVVPDAAQGPLSLFAGGSAASSRPAPPSYAPLVLRI